MTHNSFNSSTVLVSTAILLTILLTDTKSSNALPPNYSYFPYVPQFLRYIPRVSLANSDIQKNEPLAELSENTPENTSGINYWTKELFGRNPVDPIPEATTPQISLKFRSHTHRRKHLRRSEVPSGHVKFKWAAKNVVVTTEVPKIQRTTKLPRSKNPLCYFTAVACDTRYAR